MSCCSQTSGRHKWILASIFAGFSAGVLYVQSSARDGFSMPAGSSWVQWSGSQLLGSTAWSEAEPHTSDQAPKADRPETSAEEQLADPRGPGENSETEHVQVVDPQDVEHVTGSPDDSTDPVTMATSVVPPSGASPPTSSPSPQASPKTARLSSQPPEQIARQDIGHPAKQMQGQITGQNMTGHNSLSPTAESGSSSSAANASNSSIHDFHDHSPRRRFVKVRAVIVDPVWDAQLESIITNYLQVLDPEVPIRWYHDFRITDWPDRIESSIIRAAVKNARIDDFSFKQRMTKRKYNELRMKSYFYQSIAADHVLMFERDSVLCGNSPHRLSEFTAFDYIGAPWPPRVSWCNKVKPYQCCCNSGLSLVSTAHMVQVINTFHGDDGSHQNDMYLLAYRRQSRRHGFISAEKQDGMKFSIEGVWDGKDIPFGVHKPWWGCEEFKAVDLRKLHNACPEVSLLCPYAQKQIGTASRSGGRHVEAFIREICDWKNKPRG